jgi:diaminopimelate decarboxylase
MIGGCDTVQLADEFGTPLWVLDERTIREAARAILQGLSNYPDARVLYAGKAFLCLAMCRLVRQLGLGLDVVSMGELYTAAQSAFPPEHIYLHGNNKSEEEVTFALQLGQVKIVVDSDSELDMVSRLAERTGRKARVLLRVTPGVELDTHHHIRTGQTDSKFGLPLASLPEVAWRARENSRFIELLGLHCHIGSQAHDIEPYMEIVDILAECFLDLRQSLGIEMTQLDLGGGLGIAYTEDDDPLALNEWSQLIAQAVMDRFKTHNLPFPTLLLEPGRAIVGTAGVTLYRAGHLKELPGGIRYLAVDGGMADNPRPVTYQARYTPVIASRMHAPRPQTPVTIVGRYCESGDIIVKDAYLAATTGDLIAVFGTGAYNYSMASNYNRTGRPACVLVAGGRAEIILERESTADLLRQDRVPARLLND